MTKKDYELIALTLKIDFETWKSYHTHIVARHLADAFAEKNPKFNHVKFLSACGVTEK